MKGKIIGKELASAVDAMAREDIDVIHIGIGANGMVLWNLDPAHVVFIRVLVPTEAFKEFHVDEVEEMTLDTYDIARVLKKAKRNIIRLETGENKMHITLLGEVLRKFTLEDTGQSIEEPKLPDNVSQNVTVNIPPNDLILGIKD